MAKHKKVFDPLAQARTKPSAVKALEINPAGARNAGLGELAPYPHFPPEIFDCKNLVRLSVFRGIAWDGVQTIPKAIGSLSKLTHLTLGGLGYTALPAELGKLTKLVELDLVYSNAVTELPAAIGKLAKLQRLGCGYCEALTKLPSTIGNLKELRELSLGRTALRGLPKQIWDLPKLKTLYLPDELDEVPPGIGKLRSLEALAISATALVGIAQELPKLTALKHLDVSGKASSLPAQIGELANLVELRLGYLDLETLPPLGGLKKLARLAIAGNKLKTVVALVTDLPALVELDYSGNPVDKMERRMIDAAMKQPPAKRRLESIAPMPAGPKPEMIGKIASINASLTMALGDASHLAAWGGIGDDDNSDGSDWDRARVATSAREACAITFAGGKPAIALCLEVGSGIAEVYRVGDRIILCEGIGDEHLEDELFLEWMASPLDRPRKAGTLALPTRTLAILPTTDTGTQIGKLARGAIVEFGDDNCGRAIHLGWTAVKLEIERPIESSWGEARRCSITKAT